MDSQDHTNTQHSPGGKSHVCSKCGWNYPNPHPSAKNRRAHKKICGTIKGFEILDPEKEHQNLDLQKEHCLDDEPKIPSPRVVEKADISEEDVFADAVCEFSSSLVSDSIKEKEETAANGITKSATDLGETQQCNKNSEVVQGSCDIPPVKVHENFSSSGEAPSKNRQVGESSTSESLTETSQEAQFINGGDTISNVGLKTECKENIPESKLASALGKREDSSWNDDVEGPHGFAFEEMSMPGEADYTASENVPDDTCNVNANAAQVTSTVPSVPVADSHHATKGLEEFESNRSVNACFPESAKAEYLDDKPEGLSTVTEVPSSDKTETQGQTCLVAVKEFPSVKSNTDSEDIKIKDEEGVLSSFGSAQELLESETSRAVDLIVADVSHAASKTGVVDLIVHELERIQANVVAEENITTTELSSESSCDVEHYVSPLSVVLEGDSSSEQNTSKDSNRVVGGLGVIQADEIDGNVKAHNIYPEVPVRIESNDHIDFGRLQNLSEAHIRSLVLTPLVTRSGLSNEVNKPENESQSQSSSIGVAMWKNQEITMEKTTSWSTTSKEQHVPLKNLLNEARSPRLVVAAEANKIQRVSSILTSPEEDYVGWPERRQVSEEWNSPAKYPVERKVKGKPFWVPFVCCSSAAK